MTSTEVLRTEHSWIQKTLWGPIDLLHWLQAKIDRFYPGTKLAFTEWNYGGANHISGAIATLGTIWKNSIVVPINASAEGLWSSIHPSIHPSTQLTD